MIQISGILCLLNSYSKFTRPEYRKKIVTNQIYDYNENKETEKRISDTFMPCIKGKWEFGPVHEILPKELGRAFVEGMEQFGHIIKGFNDENVLLEGIESRTSSPVRIVRDEKLQSTMEGLYPCGEGAGYAGGITSAAMDGIKVAEMLAVHIIRQENNH